ncbi:hypothetical protein PIB30_001786, partial [Stylosanthes scabra]|nr:hypothetical protein [Stylosanthes scabra]
SEKSLFGGSSPLFWFVDLTRLESTCIEEGVILLIDPMDAAMSSENQESQSSFNPYRTTMCDVNESKVIEDIVGHVTSLLDSTHLFIADHPVGVNSRVQDLIQLINNHKSDDVLVIALWGMAGIGKTTIAKALYNQLSRNFDVRKFVPNISERMQTLSRVTLREELRYFLWEKVRKVPNLDQRGLKAFLVLDNVRSQIELEVLPLSLECFLPGSIIIITTRIKHDRLHELGVSHIYRVKEMDYNECVELFSWTAFKKATPERSFSLLINYAVEYSDGLPLALVAVGSALSEETIEEWETLLERFNTFPLQDVRKILKESIDSVGYSEKKMFLELAYLSHFLVGMDRNDISKLLKEAGYHDAPRAIKVLEEHSLLWFNKDKLCMHRLLQHIGREIYLKESSIESQQKPYDVFLSFRGKETRSKFISHLHASLENAGLYVFKDDNGLARGENISISLMKAIGESKTSIIILSPNYASSRWCLQELEDIMLCCKNKTQKVLPVFYCTDPSEVRSQTGKFGQAFDNLVKKHPHKLKVKDQIWRNALCEVGGLAGFVIRKSRNESEDVKNIVEHVTHMLDMKELLLLIIP